MAKKKIWVTFRKAGLHFFPNAVNHGYEDVAYLASPHRHLFHFKIAIEVFHDDREIEFHQFLNFLESKVTTKRLQNKSCEMIADDIASLIAEQYPQFKREVIIDVAEDGECGAVGEYFIYGGKVE